MLSGLPGRPGLPALLTGFNDTFLVVVRAATECVGLSAAVWIGVASGGAYLAITAWQAELSWLFFWIMQAVVRARSGIVAEQTRKASFMQACCSSADCARAAVERALTVRAMARVSRIGNPLRFRGDFDSPPSCPASTEQVPPRPLCVVDATGDKKVQTVAKKSHAQPAEGQSVVTRG